MRNIAAHLEMSVDGVVDHPERWAHDYFAPDMLEEATSQMPSAVMPVMPQAMTAIPTAMGTIARCTKASAQLRDKSIPNCR